jgi:hypothetical protein
MPNWNDPGFQPPGWKFLSPGGWGITLKCNYCGQQWVTPAEPDGIQGHPHTDAQWETWRAAQVPPLPPGPPKRYTQISPPPPTGPISTAAALEANLAREAILNEKGLLRHGEQRRLPTQAQDTAKAEGQT